MYKLNPLPERIAAADIDRLLALETATIGHTQQLGFAAPRIQPVQKGVKIAGTAVTLALPGQDSTLLHHVAGTLRPGEILVIDRLGDDKHACFGGGVALASANCGYGGAIVDGPHTDTQEIVGHGFPVWSSGPSPITTRLYDIGGAFNVPVCCGGAAVLPGYAVLADDSGVVFIAPEDLEDAISVAEEKTRRGAATTKRQRAGEKLGAITGASDRVVAKLRNQWAL